MKPRKEEPPVTNEDVKKFLEAYKKKMKNQSPPSPRPKHMVKGNTERIERGNPIQNKYKSGNKYNISAEVTDRENQARVKDTLVKSGIANPDYYSPSSDPFFNNQNTTRKRK